MNKFRILQVNVLCHLHMAAELNHLQADRKRIIKIGSRESGS